MSDPNLLNYYRYFIDPVGLPLFVGNVFNLLLYGALTLQIYLYYIYFPKDPRRLKTVVYLIYGTETVYTILLLYDLGQFVFSIPMESHPLLSPMVIPVRGAIVAFLTQAMYAHRIRVLGKLKYISWCIVVLLFLELIAVITTILFATFVSIIVWASISLVIDVIIAIAMVWSLRRNRIFSKQLKSKVTRLVHLIIGTGTLTAIINLITVILFAVPTGGAFYGPAVVLSKLYANSMMVFLNDRAPALYGRDGHVTSDVVTVPLGSLHFEIATGPADAAQAQPSSEGRDDVGSSV